MQGNYDTPNSHPLERLRNLLSPFLNLAQLLKESKKHPELEKFLEEEAEKCSQLTPQIQEYLNDCEEFYLPKKHGSIVANDQHYHVSDMYTGSTYAGLLEGRPTPQMNVWETKKLRKTGEFFANYVPFHLHTDFDIEKEVLPARSHVAWVTSYREIPKKPSGMGSHLMLAWFSSSEEDSIDSLVRTLEKIDWDNVAQNFDI